MFFHIANIEREVYWQIGNVCCSAYPIEQLDTINSSTGELNTMSALNLIVFGVSSRLLYSTHPTFIPSHHLSLIFIGVKKNEFLKLKIGGFFQIHPFPIDFYDYHGF
jgi:hypothetical protein